MRTLIICFIVLFAASACGPMKTVSNENALKESAEAQKKLDDHYTNPETSILLKRHQETFTGLNFYPLNAKYIVNARFVRTPNEKPFKMQTTTKRLPEFVKYGEAHFTLEGKEFMLNLYKPTEKPESGEEYLFLPFTDLTSGDGSYGGGRYLDFELPKGDSMVIDFNKAYNPYCAYNPKYSCPIPPEENDLLIRIEAGVMDFDMD